MAALEREQQPQSGQPQSVRGASDEPLKVPRKTALIILNTPIVRKDVFADVWGNGECIQTAVYVVSSSTPPGQLADRGVLQDRRLPQTPLYHSPLSHTHSCSFTLSTPASLRYCADGGANRLLDAFGEDEG